MSSQPVAATGPGRSSGIPEIGLVAGSSLKLTRGHWERPHSINLVAT